jgi:hypothetical protein
MEIEVIKPGEHVEVWLRFHPTEPSKAVAAGEVARLKALLGVPAEQKRVQVVVGTLALEAAQGFPSATVSGRRFWKAADCGSPDKAERHPGGDQTDPYTPFPGKMVDRFLA